MSDDRKSLIKAKLAMLRARLQALEGNKTDEAFYLSDQIYSQQEALREVLAWVEEGKDLQSYVLEIEPEARGVELEAVRAAEALLREEKMPDGAA